MGSLQKLSTELQDVLQSLSPTQKFLLDRLLEGDLLWAPHPRNVPQILAYISEADVLYFGGAAGGGKSDLILGLAVTAHKKSIIFRREYPQLQDLIERSREILSGTKASFNQTHMRWRGIPGDRTIEFGAVQHEKDREKYKGRPHDLKAFDEIPDFLETQFRFLVAWNRTTIPGQRCRVVCAGNPPTHDEGEWVIRYWAPWLDPEHSNPADPGEPRWFVSLPGQGTDIEVESGDPYEFEGEVIQPLSRTFIPSFLSNNPFLATTGYEAVLQALPEPMRSQLLLGLFTARTPDKPQQTIPKEWVKLAQQRWKEREEPDDPLDALGVDPSRGGVDNTDIAPRKGTYFLPILEYPGLGVPDGPACAALVQEALGEDLEAEIHLDIIGVGTAVYDILVANELNVTGLNFAERTDATDKSGRFRFHNLRAEAYWRLREDLDPKDGKDLALPPDTELLADLCAPTWGVTTRGIVLEPKKAVRKRLGRSPGKGDAVVMANYEASEGVLFA